MNSFGTSRAKELRTAFDHGFAELPRTATEGNTDLLAISIHNNPYALRLDAISGMYANKRITRIPIRKPALLGIAGFRGAIFPVYDLGALIGLPSVENPHWFAIVAKTDLAIAFDTFGGHLRVRSDVLVPNDSKEGGRQHLTHLLRSGDTLRGVVDLSSALRPVLGEGQA